MTHPTRALAAALGLVLAVDVLWIAALGTPGASAPERPLQRVLGGVGLGASVSPTWSFFALDPRTQSRCENEEWPLPGIPCPNPHHGASLADLPPLPRASFARD